MQWIDRIMPNYTKVFVMYCIWASYCVPLFSLLKLDVDRPNLIYLANDWNCILRSSPTNKRMTRFIFLSTTLRPSSRLYLHQSILNLGMCQCARLDGCRATDQRKMNYDPAKTRRVSRLWVWEGTLRKNQETA